VVIILDDIANVRDYMLGLDDLGQPAVIDMENIRVGKMNSAVLMIARLLYLKKGTYADQPDLGIDIIGRYRFSFEEELISLRNELKDQITTYIPEFTPVEVMCSFQWVDNKQTVLIEVTVNETAYQLVYNPENYTLDALEGT
jgi:hypothetical protein